MITALTSAWFASITEHEWSLRWSLRGLWYVFIHLNLWTLCWNLPETNSELSISMLKLFFILQNLKILYANNFICILSDIISSVFGDPNVHVCKFAGWPCLASFICKFYLISPCHCYWYHLHRYFICIIANFICKFDGCKLISSVSLPMSMAAIVVTLMSMVLLPYEPNELLMPMCMAVKAIHVTLVPCLPFYYNR